MDTSQTCCSNYNTVMKQIFPILFPFISLYYHTSRTFIVVNQNIPCEKTKGSENSEARSAQSWLCQIKIKGAHLPFANFGLGRKAWLVLKLLLFSLFLLLVFHFAFVLIKSLHTMKSFSRNKPLMIFPHHWLLKLLSHMSANFERQGNWHKW